MNCLVIDNGACVDLARILSKNFDKVYYFTEWSQGGFPPIDSYYIGRGIPEITKIDSLEEAISSLEIDLFIFTDVYTGQKQLHLLSLGKIVYGDRLAEDLELYRDKSRDLLTNLGLPVNPYEKIIGMSALREYLKIHDDQWVKINKLRGLTETFHSPDYDLIEPFLDTLEQKLGGRKDDFLFLVEPSFKEEMVEVGLDVQIVDGKYPDVVMGGIEIKDCGYCCVVRNYRDFPECMTIVTDKLSEAFKDVRGSFSDEIRINEKHESYMIDFTCRQPFPPSALQWLMYKNIAEIYLKTAQGQICNPEFDDPYGVEIIITSDWAENNWQPIRIPKSVRENVFLKNYTKKEGRDDIYYVIPQSFGLKEIGSVVASGKTIEEAINNVNKICDEIKGIKIHLNTEALDKAQMEMDKLDKFGINFFVMETKYIEPKKDPIPVSIPKKEKKPIRAISILTKGL